MGMKPSKKIDDEQASEKKEYHGDKKEKKPEFKKPEIKKETKIIRILDTNLDSNLSIKRALMKIKGIGFMFSNALCKSCGLEPNAALGTLTDEQIKMLEQSIKNPAMPSWILNRRKDIKTGKDMHISAIDITTVLRDDITLMKKMRCYKGIRHELGQPVRGQSTRSTFRTNKSVGVVRKKAAPGAAPKPKDDKK